MIYISPKLLTKIWKSLKDLHEGTSHGKENKLIQTHSQFESFMIKEDETISKTNARLAYITYDLEGLREPMFEKNQVSMILRSLSDKYYSKRNAFQEAYDLKRLLVIELCENLMEYEDERFSIKPKEKKEFSLKSKSDDETTYEPTSFYKRSYTKS